MTYIWLNSKEHW